MMIYFGLTLDAGVFMILTVVEIEYETCMVISFTTTRTGPWNVGVATKHLTISCFD